MLVLSRKQDEKIIIGDSITLMVISIQGDKVRLGIEAPKHVSIHREEVYQAIQRERGAAEQSPRNESEQPRTA
jgi:carbon storage regulator